jgi:hypothetical protein
MRKSKIFAVYVAFNIVALGIIFSHAYLRLKDEGPSLLMKREMARRFELTDLCLFTEARYTRNPSMADWSSPFQDHPTSLEHFPSGTIVTPPRHVQTHELVGKAEKYR